MEHCRLYSEWAIEKVIAILYTCASRSNLILLSLNTSDQIVDTLSLNGVYSFREQNNPHPPPLLHSKLGCLSFSTSSLNSGTTLHGGYGEGKALFLSFEVGKMSERSFREECLNYNFVTNVANSHSASKHSFNLLISRHSSFLRARN